MTSQFNSLSASWTNQDRHELMRRDVVIRTVINNFTLDGSGKETSALVPAPTTIVVDSARICSVRGLRLTRSRLEHIRSQSVDAIEETRHFQCLPRRLTAQVR
jgi:hypothetical protein